MSRLFWDVTVLREEVRDLARSYRLPADVRGRLVLSVTDLACPEFEAGHPVRLTSVFDAAHDVPQLNLTLTAPRAALPAAERRPAADRARDVGELGHLAHPATRPGRRTVRGSPGAGCPCRTPCRRRSARRTRSCAPPSPGPTTSLPNTG